MSSSRLAFLFAGVALVALLAICVSGTVSGISGQAVASQTVENVSIELDPQTVPVNETASVTVTATDANGSSETVTEDAAVSVTNGSVAAYANGTVTALELGSTTVTATYGPASDTAALTVTPPLADLVSVWDRSLFPLRADLGDAAVELWNQFFQLNSPDGEDKSAKATLGFFEPGPVTLDYSTKTGADVGQWSNRNVTVVDGRPTGVGDPLGDPATLAGIADGGLDELNRQLDFREVTRDQLDFLGRLTVQHSVSPGQHFVLMATIENRSNPTVTVEGGNLSVTGDTTIIGAEGFFVQANASTVSAPGWTPPGKDPVLSLEAPFDTEPTDHAVVLYDQQTFKNSVLTLNITGAIDASLTRDDLRVESEIGSVHGPVSVEGEPTFANRNVTSLHRVWPTSILDIAGFIASNATFEGFEVERGNETLNASVTAVSNSTTTAMAIGTDADWGPGTYRWIHLASNESGAVASSTGTIDIGGVALESLAIDLPGPVQTGESANATVTAAFANNETVSVTDLATFTSSNQTVATIDGTGTLEAHVPGETTVTATYENGTATATVTVNPTPAVFELEVPNDGSPHSIATPGPLVGSLADLFPNGTAGVTSVFSYDGGWTHHTDLSATTLVPREAVVITTDGQAGPDTIPIRVEFALNSAPPGLEARPGWNLVSGTAFTDVGESFANSSATLVLDRYPHPSGPLTPAVPSFDHYVLGASQWGDDPPEVSPFGGYFVYHKTATHLPVTVQNVRYRADAVAKLGLSD